MTNSSLTNPSYYKLEKFDQSKLDQLLCTIHSLVKLNLTWADFYLDFDDDNKKFVKLVQEFIQTNYKNTNIRIFPFRLEYFHQWKSASKMIPSEAKTILLMNNLDHAFIPKDNQRFSEFISFLETQEPNAIGGILHWQELIHGLGIKKVINQDKDSPIFYNYTYYTHGTTIIKTDFFKSWWNFDFTQGKRIVRPDNPFGPYVNFKWAKRYVPCTEFFRHLDGYGHVGITAPHAGRLIPCCRYVNGRIIHTDWKVGFLNFPDAQLPHERPNNLVLARSKFEVNNEARDYLINVNSWHFSPKRSIQLIEPENLIANIKLRLYLVNLLKHKYLRLAFYRNVGSLSLNTQRIKYFVVIKYFSLQEKYQCLPNSIKNIFKIGFIKSLPGLIKDYYKSPPHH